MKSSPGLANSYNRVYLLFMALSKAIRKKCSFRFKLHSHPLSTTKMCFNRVATNLENRELLMILVNLEKIHEFLMNFANFSQLLMN